MPKLLTVRKQKWAAARPNVDIIRGTPLNPNAAVMTRYQSRLEKLVRQMTDDCEKQLKALFSTTHAEAHMEAIATGDASISSQARMLTNALTKKYEDLFAAVAKPIAEQMVAGADATSSAALHSSLKQLSGGLSLSTASLRGPQLEIWKASIAENVSLIKSIPAKYLSGVTQATQRAIISGNGLQDLVPYLLKHKGITERRAKFIAHDQTRKAFSALNRSRMTKLGLTQGEWLHTSGSKEPRHTHIEMSGKLYDLKKGMWDPAVGQYIFPAEEPGCRCRAIPVLSLDSIGE